MAESFSNSVEDGLMLAKRIYFGKDRATAPPTKLPMTMEKSLESFLPTAPMVYAVIYDPGIVDNPDLPSYQPHVHGRCDPPAMIPLQMNGIQAEVDCYLDTAFVQVSGTWKVHCVMASRSCDCRIAVPMGDQGSILGIEVVVSRKSYSTQVVAMGENDGAHKEVKAEDGGHLKPDIFVITIPAIHGGSNMSIKISWSQKLSHRNGQFSLDVPFKFPAFVTPVVKKIMQKEKIQINVNTSFGTEVMCKTTSHPLKKTMLHAGKLGFLYEAAVLSWSSSDISCQFAVHSSQISGRVLLQSPSVEDTDQRDMFCMYLYPGDLESKLVFRKNIVFVIDISGSMRGKLLDDTKNALYAALSNLNPEDTFGIIAFNGETYIFSTSLEAASKEAVERAIQWIIINFIPGGGTDILHPLTMAVEMLSSSNGSAPIVFLVTDGTVENERTICDTMKTYLVDGESIRVRIYTLGVGSFCNHYFLRMLAMIGRGHYAAAVDLDLIESQMQKLLTTASSLVLANITVDTFKDLDEIEVVKQNFRTSMRESVTFLSGKKPSFRVLLHQFLPRSIPASTANDVYPSHIPDLASESPLILSGRYNGKFPENVKAKGVLANMHNLVVDLKVQREDIPLDRVCAKEQIELLTAEAWLSQDKQLEQKAARLSLQSGFVSEFTRLSILETIEVPVKPIKAKKAPKVDTPEQRRILLKNFCVGFGDLTATAENVRPGCGEANSSEVADFIVKAASKCCGKLCDRCCCMCCIQCCSKMNEQCAIVLSQLLAGFACLGCFSCVEMCCSGEDG